MSKIRTIITILAFFVALPATLYAVDTTETFAPGIVTDYELYYSYGWNKLGKAHGLEFLIGGGPTESLSYFITGAYVT